MPLRILNTKNAPQPVGPYSQAVEVAPFVFISGQLPLDPVSGSLVGSRIHEQARQALRNLTALLAASGLSPASLVKTTVYLRSMADFGTFNEIYEEELRGVKPARSVVEVSALPRGALVEIEAMAYR